MKDAKRSLDRVVALDQVVKATAARAGKETLILFSADHSYDLRVPMNKEKQQPRTRDIVSLVALEDQHTIEEVPVFAIGPGSDQVQGFIPNARVFDYMLHAFGWTR
jgi:alkaline phosphatase